MKKQQELFAKNNTKEEKDNSNTVFVSDNYTSLHPNAGKKNPSHWEKQACDTFPWVRVVQTYVPVYERKVVGHKPDGKTIRQYVHTGWVAYEARYPYRKKPPTVE